MRAVITLLVLLFSMCGGQSRSTQAEVQKGSRSTGASAAAAAQLDVTVELTRLSETVEKLGSMVVELRVALSFTQDELQNTKNLLFKMEDENNEQQRELAVMRTEVMNLKMENAAQETELITMTEVMNLKLQNAAQETTLITIRTEVMNLKLENEAQEEELALIKTRMDTGEIQMVNLMEENATQVAELTEVNNRLGATETKVENLEKAIMDKPKVAFSAALTESEYIQAGNTELNLVFTKTITNVGQAYNSINGFFTAPVKGVYYFRFTVMDLLPSRWMNIKMSKNGQWVIYLAEYDTDGYDTYLSSGVTLQLDVGDLVNLSIPAGYRLYDFTNNSIFSGFLLFFL